MLLAELFIYIESILEVVIAALVIHPVRVIVKSRVIEWRRSLTLVHLSLLLLNLQMLLGRIEVVGGLVNYRLLILMKILMEGVTLWNRIFGKETVMNVWRDRELVHKRALWLLMLQLLMLIRISETWRHDFLVCLLVAFQTFFLQIFLLTFLGLQSIQICLRCLKFVRLQFHLLHFLLELEAHNLLVLHVNCWVNRSWCRMRDVLLHIEDSVLHFAE